MAEPFIDHDDLVDAWMMRTVAMLRGEPLDDEFSQRLRATQMLVVPLPIMWPRMRLGLTATEDQVLAVLVAHELSPEARKLVRERNTENVSDPTFDALRRIVYGAGVRLRTWRELGPDGALRRLGLIERTDGTGDAPEQRQTFKVAQRVLALAHGDLALDPGLAELVVPTPHVRVDALELCPGAADRVREAIIARTRVIVCGKAGTGRRSLLAALLRETKLDPLIIDGRSISVQRDLAARQLRTVAREARLLERVPLVVNLDALCGRGDLADRLDLFDRELDGFALATSNVDVARRWLNAPITIELGPLPSTQRAALWRRAVPRASESDAKILATMYPLAPALVAAAGVGARQLCGDGRMTPDHIEAGIRTVLDDKLAGLAKRIEVTQTWDDLVLPEEQFGAIVELLARIRARDRVYEEWGFARKVGKGLGVSALLSGPPGTGKTMAAGLIARELRVGLYQVDLSKIVSKWIGETEKNLATLFDAAEAGHAVLLFDEADALFGKRSEVQSSNDRHANQEVNYLLQRLESFTGICILTTNHDTAIDEAFRRRFTTHVRFQIPETAERCRMWQAMLPSAAPRTSDLRIDELAERSVMSGGHIRNAVLRAAFLAANDDVDIDAIHLHRAAMLEYEAMGKVMPSVV